MSSYSDLKGTTNTTFSIGGKPALWLPVRQTVLTGRVDTTASHQPANALSSGSGLNVTLNASSTVPFRATFAEGFDSNVGGVNYFGQYTSNSNIGTSQGLAANSTNYLYINRHTITGVISIGALQIAPIYDHIIPSSPTVNQFWFDLNEYKMKRWGGSSWAIYHRVFIGEAITNDNSVTSVITYAYQGIYRSPWTAVDSSIAVNYSFSHNLGMSTAEANALISYYGRINSSDRGILVDYFDYESGTVAGMRTVQITNNQRNVIIGQVGTYLFYAGTDVGSGFVMSGDMRVIVKRGW